MFPKNDETTTNSLNDDQFFSDAERRAAASRSCSCAHLLFLHLWKGKDLLGDSSGVYWVRQGWVEGFLSQEATRKNWILSVFYCSSIYSIGWWFGTWTLFFHIGNNLPNWLIFFRGVETTNQTLLVHFGRRSLDELLSRRLWCNGCTLDSWSTQHRGRWETWGWWIPLLSKGLLYDVSRYTSKLYDSNL